MSDLKEMIRTVEVKCQAPLARVHATQPKSAFGADGAYSRWRTRLQEVEREVEAAIVWFGGSVKHGDGVRVRMFGITASSTQGLTMALKNWQAGAEKRLSEAKGVHHG